MGRTKTNQKILEAACENADAITKVLKELDALIPPESKDQAEALWIELQHRMSFQDYLYDCHRPFVPWHKIILDFEEYDASFRKAGIW